MDLVHLFLRALGGCCQSRDRQARAVERFMMCLEASSVVPEIYLPRCKLIIDAVSTVADFGEELALVLLARSLVQFREMRHESR